ncbi:MAG: hypothetical protein ACRDTE_27345 [Pseudonocardiaceae bacterium]
MLLVSGRAGASAGTAADQDERRRNGLEAGATDRLHELVAGLSSADRKPSCCTSWTACPSRTSWVRWA